MKYFLDTEFIESGPEAPIYLISLGIVSEDGRKYYAINGDCPFHLADEWVQKNVLDKIDTTEGIPLKQIRQELLDFIRESEEKPEFWAYYADYDWVVFCQIFGRMIDLPKEWPKYCKDLKQELDRLKAKKIPEPVGEHNALVDAIWNLSLYRHLAKNYYLGEE